MPKGDIAIVRCPAEARSEALAVLYRDAAEGFRTAMTVEALADAQAGRLDLSGLWVALRGDRVVGAVLTQTLAGRAAAVWPPEVAGTLGRGRIAAALVAAALDGLRAQGVRVAQALVDPESPVRAARDLTAGGLPRVSELVYMRRDVAPPIEPGPVPLDWRPFSRSAEPEFREVLEATYEGSLDMPELEGVRSLDDILAGHRAAGRFRPELWRLGRVPGEPDAAAALLLSEPPEGGWWEVSYLGLTPRARGRGLGRTTLAHGLALAAERGVERLELAVDVRNLPAERLYLRTGFAPFERRAVHLAVFRTNNLPGERGQSGERGA